MKFLLKVKANLSDEELEQLATPGIGQNGSNLQFLITTEELEEPQYEHPSAARRPGGG